MYLTVTHMPKLDFFALKSKSSANFGDLIADVQLTEVIMKAFDYFEKVTCIRLQRLRDRPLDKQSLQSVEWLYISNPSGVKQCVHSNEKKPNQGVQVFKIKA